MWTSLAIVVFCSLAGRSSGGAGVESNFECYPNQTIQFTNPDTGLYTHFKAFYDDAGSDTDCIVTTDDGKNYANLDCASTTATVTLYISSRNLSNDSILDKDSAAYTFKCSTITSYNESLSNSLGVNMTETSESKAPIFNITSAFYSQSGEIVTEATVGQTVYYVISGPSQYDLKPLQCNATGSLADEHTTLIVDGCSEDSDLIQDFEVGSDINQQTNYSAAVHVFKFYKSDSLTITCNVRVCSDSDDCSMNCDLRRKRFDIVSSDYRRDVSDDLKMSTVGNSLRILDAQLGESTKVAGSMQHLLISLVLLSVMFF